MEGPPCPVHPEVVLRREHFETGFCLKCLRHHDLCTAVRYMDMCKLLRDHEGPHQGTHGHMWTMIGSIPVDTSDETKGVEHLLFPVIRQDFSPKPKPELLMDYGLGEPIPGTKCMRCSEPRWKHPTEGEIVLCEAHGFEVALGLRRAPPLRRNIDYSSAGRRTFLVEQIPGLPVYDRDPEGEK